MASITLPGIVTADRSRKGGIIREGKHQEGGTYLDAIQAAMLSRYPALLRRESCCNG